MADLQRDQFQARLQRIQKGGAHCAGEILVGPVDEEVARGKKKAGGSVLPSLRETVLYPLAIVATFLAGMAAVLAARYVRYHLTGGSISGEDADIAMMMDLAIAGMVAVFVRIIFRTRGHEMAAAKTAGIAVMICIMHNFVHYAPDTFAVIFSPDWVEETVAITEPNSILFRGVSFVLAEPEAPPPEPTILRLD